MRCGAAWLFAALLLSSGARAEPVRRPALHWVRLQAADRCIDPRSLAQRVERITGSVLVSAATADLSIEAQIRPADDGAFAVSIQLTAGTTSAAGERTVTLRASECRRLDDAIAFLIAMSIDPSLGSEGALSGLDWLATDASAEAEQLERELVLRSPSPARDVLVEIPAATADRARITTRPQRPPAEDRSRWELSAAVGGGRGPTAGMAAGAVVSIERHLSPHFALAGQLRTVRSLDARAFDSLRSVTTQTVAAAAMACLSLLDPRVIGLAGCAGPEFQVLIASGRGFADEAVAVMPSLGIATRLDAEHRLSASWGLVVSAHAQLDVVPPTVYFRQDGERVNILEAEALALQLFAGVTHAF